MISQDQHLHEQTIYALASGLAPSAIAIVRVSGSKASGALELLCGHLPTPRMAMLAILKTSEGNAIDESVVLWFPAPNSSTGEDVAEFQIHGGRAVIAALFDALSHIDGLRPAEPGEFTRRAFENGKLDLTEAEGLDDLIQADTDQQRRQALRQLKGLLGDKAESWRKQIVDASALIEAGIDFSDEGDVPQELQVHALRKVAVLKSEIEKALDASARSERLRDGLIVAIAGLPNAGKSTLLNRLARREVAIVSPYAGTTRDIIEVHLDLGGYPVTLLDTAGVRETDDPVEQEGVRRARQWARDADLVLWLVDASSLSEIPPVSEGENHAPVWLMRNKVDLLKASGENPARQSSKFDISAEHGEGLSELLAALTAYAQSYFGAGESALIGRERHRMLLRQSVEALSRAEQMAGHGDELMAEELRIAAYALGRLTGRVNVEDLLDVIFREFCIGK
jgi:tRNA modification GTPase